MPILVNRCVCFSRTFAELKTIADRTGAASVEQLQEHVDFGFNCRLCHPYVRRMLRTGETEFREILQESPDS